ncbi:hypothetical protein F6P93_07910 [Escherichia coli]|nr:hypothetical protein F6P93_07910 [Escherichia coli]
MALINSPPGPKRLRCGMLVIILRCSNWFRLPSIKGLFPHYLLSCYSLTFGLAQHYGPAGVRFACTSGVSVGIPLMTIIVDGWCY